MLYPKRLTIIRIMASRGGKAGGKEKLFLTKELLNNNLLSFPT
ncbi:hypothetical protein COO91_02994 [Nostoc flagelliforme CCNUN1]|uniref:Uncharacterized protein n=1 Tax=Nostoc flagelliforme CCNUN1 TaxID=2038116 RepID=A0A2K8SNP0_9NOSO|nr:hypothetical protein COO91_02994 [Nostoc flagelliforme CCNUN1]